MLLEQVVATSQEVGATRSRKAKAAALAGCIARMEPTEVRVGAGYLVGRTRQQRLDVGWRTINAVQAAPAAEATLTIADVDAAFDDVAAAHGAGSVAARSNALISILERATVGEQEFLRGLMLGELRQGALEGMLVPAIAHAFDVSEQLVRRASMLAGSITDVGGIAALEGRDGLAGIRLEPGRPIQPMLAASDETVESAVERFGTCAVEAKLDGVRIQVHRVGDDIRIWSRTLKELTARLPEVIAVVAALPASQLVLDGEVLRIDAVGRPRPFAETMQALGDQALVPFFFDCLHHDGVDLLDRPLRTRRTMLARAVPADYLVNHRVATTPEEGSDAMAAAMGAGQEGVVVKDLDAPYEAGRRGAAWRKVKPVHTLDLVVIAVEWGSGRRRGWLSNLHLAARDPDTDGYIMLGKTFKGMTDELLAWQTEQLLARETTRDGHVVHVRPELVVEIAFDGVQSSTRYPGGVTLRFARVKRYRDDKAPDQADTIDAVRSLRL